MQRKDCEYLSGGVGQRASSTAHVVVLLALVACAPVPSAHAGTIRLWPTAVVVDESVRIADLCEFRGFDPQIERSLAEFEVADSPPRGESVVVTMQAVRKALVSGGANFATVTLRGATRCVVSRPSAVVDSHRMAARRTSHGLVNDMPADPPAGNYASTSQTLRQAVMDYYDAALSRLGGRADVVFDRSADSALSLSSPTYDFRIRQRSSDTLGLVQLDVDVVQNGRLIQTVPLVVRVSLIRHALVARRGINQGATIQARDVELTSLTFTRLDKLGVDDTSVAVGQRAKRFIPAGDVISPDSLESVPLVTRGQLVTLTSVSGLIRVVTTAKAMSNGLLGESIAVRALDNKRIELDAQVVGSGEVLVGNGPVADRLASLATGGTP